MLSKQELQEMKARVEEIREEREKAFDEAAIAQGRAEREVTYRHYEIHEVKNLLRQIDRCLAEDESWKYAFVWGSENAVGADVLGEIEKALDNHRDKEMRKRWEKEEAEESEQEEDE